MNKITLVILTIMAFTLMLTPIALAKPGAPKNNDKFEYFELYCSGVGSGTNDREWWTPANVPIEENKTYHARGGGWVSGPILNMTVGEETFTMDTEPYNITWTTTFDSDVIRNNTGAIKRMNIRLTDVVTLYDADNATIGTLVLELKASIVPTRIPIYSGTLVGSGTGALKGVHLSGIDVGFVGAPPPTYMRNGTITGWPEDITNP